MAETGVYDNNKPTQSKPESSGHDGSDDNNSDIEVTFASNMYLINI